MYDNGLLQSLEEVMYGLELSRRLDLIHRLRKAKWQFLKTSEWSLIHRDSDIAPLADLLELLKAHLVHSRDLDEATDRANALSDVIELFAHGFTDVDNTAASSRRRMRKSPLALGPDETSFSLNFASYEG